MSLLSVLINISCRRISTFAFTNEEGETKEMYALKGHSSQIIYTRMLRDKVGLIKVLRRSSQWQGAKQVNNVLKQYLQI